MAGAVALLGTAGFTSCKEKNGPVDPGTYNGETVKTEIVIALPNEAAGGDKVLYMPGKTVQKNGRTDFQGMTGIILVPFSKQSGKIEGTDARIGTNISLGEIAAATELGTNSNAKYYADKNVPLTTASFLFYGKSKAVDATGDDLKFKTGVLAMNNAANTNPSAFEFSLEFIHDDPLFSTSSPTEADGLLTYLTSIANATDGAKKWCNYEVGDGAGMKAMFDEFKKMHGLSSFEVERVLSDLYTSLNPVTTTLATNIKTAIANATYATVNTSDPAHCVVTLESTYQNFPAKYDLPVGCVDIMWDDSDADDKKFVEGNYTNMARPSQFTYPSELWYFANSLIKTSATSKATLYNNTNEWGTILAAYEGAAGSSAVNSSTRAIAIYDTIQYGVARLDVTVKIADDVLADNSDLAEGKATDVTCASYPVTGVLVGGQRKVGFNFEPKGDVLYTIYDKVMATSSMAATEAGSVPNHTLVLETPASADIKVAVEMTNNSGKDFYGVGNQLIPAGSKFYVVGELKGTEATKTGNKVFKQDYTTTANFTLNNLRRAYNTIPDLRTPQLEIGFSVNLSWKNGNTFDVVIE